MFYDLEAEDPFLRMKPRKNNVALVIREGLKDKIESLIKENSKLVKCTDIERLQLMMEEVKITYCPLQDDGNVDRSAPPLTLDRNSDLSQIFKEHVQYTTVGQLLQPSAGPITFTKYFIYGFQIDASRITMPPEWQRDTVVNADEISSPRVPSVNERASNRKVSFTTSDQMMQGILDSQILLARHLDPATFGKAITTAVSSALTTTIGAGTFGAEVGHGTSKAMTDVLIPALQAGIPTVTAKMSKIPGSTAVTTCGAPSNPLTIKLGPHESICDFITELPRTSGKIPRLGAWNHNILPACVKARYDVARDLNSFLTCDQIDTAYVYDVDDGTTGLLPGEVVTPTSYTSRTYFHPCMSGAFIDRDGWLLQPNFDPEGFLKTGTKLQDVRGNLMRAWYEQMRGEAMDHGLYLPPYSFFHDTLPSNYLTCGSDKDDVLPSHCSGLVARWSACLATYF